VASAGDGIIVEYRRYSTAAYLAYLIANTYEQSLKKRAAALLYYRHALEIAERSGD
jgi:hypothetical protein